MAQKVLIFVVSYNAERFVEQVLDRLPADVWTSTHPIYDVLVIDDASKDKTFERASGYAALRPSLPIQGKLTVLTNPVNQGYGGNQKLGYTYAIENGYDAVVLLHGDGQYPPERVIDVSRPLLAGEAEAMFGSRMLRKEDALKGGMPLYKWFGNQILTQTQNSILGTRLSEFHSGFRAYATRALKKIPFQHNSNYFDFDTDIIIQVAQTGQRIGEIPIPTHYGDETCHVDGVKYARLILKSSLLAKIQPLGIYYHPKFDYDFSRERYQLKLGYPSSDEFALGAIRTHETVLEISRGAASLAPELKKKGHSVLTEPVSSGVSELPGAHGRAPESDQKVSAVLLMDVIEHLRDPEAFLANLRNRFGNQDTRFVISTGNIGFLPMRISLLLGQFNYSRRGILDLDHTRLFTFKTLKRTLELSGFEVEQLQGLPAPFPLAFGLNSKWAAFLLKLNQWFVRIWPALFSYQIALVARARPTVAHLLENAKVHSESRRTQPA